MERRRRMLMAQTDAAVDRGRAEALREKRREHFAKEESSRRRRRLTEDSEGAYAHLASETDHANLKWLKEFNRFDLYSKSDDLPAVEEVLPYYQGLLTKYGLSGKLMW